MVVPPLDSLTMNDCLEQELLWLNIWRTLLPL